MPKRSRAEIEFDKVRVEYGPFKGLTPRDLVSPKNRWVVAAGKYRHAMETIANTDMLMVVGQLRAIGFPNKEVAEMCGVSTVSASAYYRHWRELVEERIADRELAAAMLDGELDEDDLEEWFSDRDI